MEIKSAANFLSNLLRLGNKLQDGQLDQFRGNLEDLLNHHYQQHWFPEKPNRGSGYRCLRINHKMDPIIAKAGFACGVDEASLRHLFPNELTLWIDPKEVSYRIGENGSICVLFDGSLKNNVSATILSADKSDRFKHHKQQVVSGNKNNVHHQVQNHHSGSRSISDLPRPTVGGSSCKDSMRGTSSWDSFIMDPRNVNLEQLAAYVSS